MTAESDVIRLLHEADWTRLNLAAEVSDGSRVVIAPGGRFRQQGPDGVFGSDGGRSWRSEPAQARGAPRVNTGDTPLPMLLSPAWLLRSSQLDVRGPVTACGRDAVHVTAIARASISDTDRRMVVRPGRTEAYVDAELGILLRVAWVPSEPADDVPPDVTELVSLDLDPAVDPAQFAPPPGSSVVNSPVFGSPGTGSPGSEGPDSEDSGSEGPGESTAAGGPWSDACKTAGGLAAEGLVALIRHWPSGHARTEAGPADPDAAMPLAGPAPEMTPDGRLAGSGVSDEVLALLHGSGTAAFDGTLHGWQDDAVMLSRVSKMSRQAGMGGFMPLVEALAERDTAPAHSVSSVRVGGPGRYQIDWLQTRGKGGPKTTACDGRRRWQVYDDKITVGPAKPPSTLIGDIADTSWLLECRLAGGDLIMAGDRPAYRIEVTRGSPSASFLILFSPAVAVVDAELGILLTLTCYYGQEQAARYELRDLRATRADDFQVDIPAGLPTEPETDRWEQLKDADFSRPGSVAIKMAGIMAREAGQEATKAARNFLRRLGSP